jgi:rhodanese-related sulfurtransferase
MELMVLAIAPFDIDFATVGGWLIYLLIGVGFGATLEMAGFSYAPNLAAQFYGRDMRVLKTMFSAIVTAMTLIFLSSAVGALDFRAVGVAATYLWPGIVGGLIMGAGFVVGGFCPGTSLAAAATGSRDALFYIVGLMVGIFGFGETVSYFTGFWNSSNLGRLTIPEWLGVPTALVVVAVIAMALGVFILVERVEQSLGSTAPRSSRRLAVGLASAAVVLAAITVVAQQPGWEEQWGMVAAEQQPLLDAKDVHVHPGELLALMHGDENVVLVDIQNQVNYDCFHIEGVRHERSLDALYANVSDLKDEPAGTIYVTIGENETVATDAWRILKAQHVPNVYILEGGTGKWLATFGTEAAAAPDPGDYDLQYDPKITEVTETTLPEASGGCG